MEREQTQPSVPRADTPARTDMPERVPGADIDDASLGELFKRLTSDTGDLIRKEIALARVELAQTAQTLARDGAKLGTAAAIGLVGLLSVTACLVIAIGAAIGNYWLSALIVGVPLLVIAAVLGRNAVNDVRRRGLKPAETVATLREDQEWVKQEAQELKREIQQR